ncbi:MAG: phosphoenolpyruvate--protein phosphotransferase [bacterium]
MIDKDTTLKAEYCFKGVPVSPGVAIGKVFILSGESVKIEERHIKNAEIETEINNFNLALEKSKSELKTDTASVVERIGIENAKIFETHHLLLDDPCLIEETITAIRQEKKSADFAFYSIIEKYQKQLSGSNDEYMRDRTADLRDIKRRVVRNIRGSRVDILNKLQGAAIIFARDLTPSDTIALDKHKVLGFVTDLGGKTSHSAIMDRSFRVPAAVGLRNITKYIKSGDRVILDGKEGLVYINPERKTLDHYRKLQKKIHAFNKQLANLKTLPARTLDGKEIELAANLEFTDELDTVIEYGGRGIGLYRTDYMYLARPDLPTEDEQYEEYKIVVERMRPYPVIIRTLDVGGDKNPQNIHIPPEDNPYLGFRAIRICLEDSKLFLTQLKAILRASVYGNVKILFPMVSGVAELLEAKATLEKAKVELKRKRIPFQDKIDIGVMIEVPSSAVITDLLADEVDFLSIGTNDLVQYTLAVDRGNDRIAYLYKDLHPAVLRLIKSVIDAAHRKGTWVGICGEMGGNPLATLILLGLGIDELSVSPIVLPEIKSIIRSVDFRETVKIANHILEMKTADEIEKFMMKYIRKNFKDLVF